MLSKLLAFDSRYSRDNLLLDASKTGLRLKKNVLQEDRKKFGGPDRYPPSMGGTGAQRDDFALDILSSDAKKFVDQLLARYDEASKFIVPDSDLLNPWKLAKARARHPDLSELIRERLSDELRRLEDHVDRALKQYKQVVSRQSSTEEDGKSGQVKKAVERQRQRDKNKAYALALQTFTSDVPGILLLTDVNRIKASYAYHKCQPFAFNVASQELCCIKADAQGGTAAIRVFDQVKTISPACRKLFENATEAINQL